MEILPSLLSWIDSSVRTVKSNISDLVNDPLGHTEKQVTNIYSTLLKSLGYSEKDQEDYQVAVRDNPEVLHRMKQSENIDVGQFLGVGTFISKGSKLWDPAAERIAMKLQGLGMEPKKIWQKTGTWLDTPDKIPLQEISDKSSSLNVRKMTSTPDGEMISGPLQNTVGDHLIHDELFKAYPDLKDIPAFLDYGKSVPNHGVFTDAGDLISVSGKDYGNTRSILLHELQHAIQRKEGMGRGGSPSAIPNDPSTKDVFYRALDRLKAKGIEGDEAKTIAADTIYHVLYGEGLARATQKRADMTAVERLFNYPPDSFDYPIEKAIVRK